jgi:hypothetical protein
MKTGIEITVKEDTDTLKVQAYLLTIPGIKKAYIVSFRTIRVYYDDTKIAAKLILKAVARSSAKRNSRNRNQNAASIRQL